MKKPLILVLNCGSSSIKFAVLDPKSEAVIVAGLAQRIGTENANLKYNFQSETVTQELPHVCYRSAMIQILNLIKSNREVADQLAAVGHRIVHGGEKFTHSVIVDPTVIASIRESITLAPLHNAAHIIGIEEAENAFPDLKQVTVFDTAFHQTMPDYAYLYALPYELYSQYKVRKYGFHGTSHRFVSNRAAALLGLAIDQCSMITAHLGNGCSVAAIRNGQSLDTTMGLTPLAGLVMGTRSGDVDPGLHQYLAKNLGYSLEKITDILNKESGMLGLSGVDSDLRPIEDRAEQGDVRCNLALDTFCYRLAKQIASFLVALGGKPDALVFTGGIGENSRIVRARTLKLLQVLGLTLDPTRNAVNGKHHHGIITIEESLTVAIVVPTNEELMIAQDTMQLASE